MIFISLKTWWYYLVSDTILLISYLNFSKDCLSNLWNFSLNPNLAKDSTDVVNYCIIP